MRKNRGKEPLAIALLMVLTCCFCACQNEDYPEKIVRADNIVGNRYASFFSSERSAFFDDGDRDAVIVIDSKEDLQRAYRGPASLPDIPFNGHTLVLCRVMLPYGRCDVENQSMTMKDVKATINVSISQIWTGGWPEDVHAFFTWGLYPKQNIKKTSINKVIENEAGIQDKTEDYYLGQVVPVKRANRSSLPSWLVKKADEMNAMRIYEGRLNGSKVYIINGQSGWTNSDIDFVWGGGTMSAYFLYDSSGKEIDAAQINEVTDVICIYYT